MQDLEHGFTVRGTPIAALNVAYVRDGIYKGYPLYKSVDKKCGICMVEKLSSSGAKTTLRWAMTDSYSRESADANHFDAWIKTKDGRIPLGENQWRCDMDKDAVDSQVQNRPVTLTPLGADPLRNAGGDATQRRGASSDQSSLDSLRTPAVDASSSGCDAPVGSHVPSDEEPASQDMELSASDSDQPDEDVVPAATQPLSVSGDKRKAPPFESTRGQPTKKVKAPKQPESAPKKARSAYILFCKSERAKATNLSPATSGSDITKILGQRWQKLDAAARARYEEEAAADKLRYAEELTAWKAQHHDGVAAASPSAPQKVEDVKDPDAPKRPLSAYSEYVSQQPLPRKPAAGSCRIATVSVPLFSTRYPLSWYVATQSAVRHPDIRKENPDIAFGAVSKLISEEWRVMPEHQKAPYTAKAEAAKAQYDIDKANYGKLCVLPACLSLWQPR